MSSDNHVDDAFVDGVRSAMHGGVADLSVPPTLLPGLRKRYARRIAARRAGMAAVPLAVAALVGGLVTTVDPGPSSPTLQVQDVSHVTSRVITALDGVENDVVHVTGTETGQGKYSRPGKPAVFHNWMLADGTAFRAQILVDGQPVWGHSINQDGDIIVDHRNRTWKRHLYSGVPSWKGPRKVLTDVLTPAQIKEAMAGGHLQIVGEGDVINGKPTIHLRGDLPQRATPPIGFWIDQTTYLPVRLEYKQGENREWDSPRDITWLPPTEESLAMLTTPVPDGFTQLPN